MDRWNATPPRVARQQEWDLGEFYCMIVLLIREWKSMVLFVLRGFQFILCPKKSVPGQ